MKEAARWSHCGSIAQGDSPSAEEEDSEDVEASS